jgi:transcriptional regulator with PAS, ATPase and Fis domain
MQVKFLRVLQERRFERVGGNQAIEVDLRFVFATNRDLLAMTQKGEFREDLFYRVNVVPVYLPPLRERRQDIPLVAEALLRRLRRKLGLDVRGVTDAGLDALLAYDYPGNVRELENVLERAFIRLRIRGGDRVDVEDLPLELRGAAAASGRSGGLAIPESYDGLRKIEREMILQALQRTGWNKRKAAQLIGITHQTLYNRLEEFKIKRDGE